MYYFKEYIEELFTNIIINQGPASVSLIFILVYVYEKLFFKFLLPKISLNFYKGQEI